MSHESLYGKQVNSVFIQMGAKSMPEGVAGNPALPSKSVLMGMDMSGKEKRINGSVLPILLWEEITGWFPVGKPVLCQQIKGSFPEEGITGRTVFGVGKVEASVLRSTS